jgi:hypothetical protein
MTAATGGERSLPTHSSRRRFSWRATGLLWNSTFADAVKQISVGDSSRSQVGSIDRERVSTDAAAEDICVEMVSTLANAGHARAKCRHDGLSSRDMPRTESRGQRACSTQTPRVGHWRPVPFG